MKIFTRKKELQEYLLKSRSAGKTLGLVPTMGALHAGHISLLKQAKQSTDEVVCSIFVNPTQFNDPADLEKYPRPIQDDIQKLEKAACDILFNPDIYEMYAANEQWHLDIGELEHLLEGKFRQGHYQGVMQIVFKLFDLVKPDIAFFGQKDYQQFLVIQKMVDSLHMQVRLVMCPIQRDEDGLAMSSRNIHLSPEERRHALVLSRALIWIKDNFDIADMEALVDNAKKLIANEDGVNLEYLNVSDGNNLQPATRDSKRIVALLAAKVGKTRLIDNIIIA